MGSPANTLPIDRYVPRSSRVSLFRKARNVSICPVVVDDVDAAVHASAETVTVLRASTCLIGHPFPPGG